MTKNEKELSEIIKIYTLIYILICIYIKHEILTPRKKNTLLDNVMELNLFNVGSLWFSYSIKRLCQVQNFKMKLQSYAPFNKVMSYFVAFFEEKNMNAILAVTNTT